MTGETSTTNQPKSSTGGGGDENFVVTYWKTIAHENKAKGLYFASALLFALFMVLLIAQALGFPRASSRPRESIIVFTDGDVDDLMALHLLYKRSDIAIPLIVVSGTGIAAPRAALANVRNFVSLMFESSSTAVVEKAAKTRIVLGNTLARRDFTSSMNAGRAGGPCSYERFARSEIAVSVAADSLYGQASVLASEGKKQRRQYNARRAQAGPSSAPAVSNKTLSDEPLFTAVARAVNGVLRNSGGNGDTPNKLTLLSLGPTTDVSAVMDFLASEEQQGTTASSNNAGSSSSSTQAIQNSLLAQAVKLVVISGGKFGSSSSGSSASSSSSSSSSSSIADASIFTQDRSRGVGNAAELNFFLDPESANNVLTTYGGKIPIVVVPLDVGGSVGAYVDYPDQWSRISSTTWNRYPSSPSFTSANNNKHQASKSTTPTASAFLAAALTSFSNFEGATFFPFKGTPKSVSAVAVLLDRGVRSQLYALKRTVGVIPWDYAQSLQDVNNLVGRSGHTYASHAQQHLDIEDFPHATVDVVSGFAAGGTSRMFMDLYLRTMSLP